MEIWRKWNVQTCERYEHLLRWMTGWNAHADSVTAAISLKNISEGDNPQSLLTPAPALIFLKKILSDCISGCCRQTKDWIRKLNQENQERGHIRETWELEGCPRLHNQMWKKKGEESKITHSVGATLMGAFYWITNHITPACLAHSSISFCNMNYVHPEGGAIDPIPVGPHKLDLLASFLGQIKQTIYREMSRKKIQDQRQFNSVYGVQVRTQSSFHKVQITKQQVSVKNISDAKNWSDIIWIS